jgi:hypothetical protein
VVKGAIVVAAQINFDEVDSQFSKQISKQVDRATAELNQLEQLLKAGMVDKDVLTDFRESVNRVRHTGWAVQQAMEAPSSKEDVTFILTLERVRAATQLNAQLVVDLGLIKEQGLVDQDKLTTLRKEVQCLANMLDEMIKRENNPLDI